MFFIHIHHEFISCSALIYLLFSPPYHNRITASLHSPAYSGCPGIRLSLAKGGVEGWMPPDFTAPPPAVILDQGRGVEPHSATVATKLQLLH